MKKLLLALSFLLPLGLLAQTTIYSENFGVVAGNSTIAANSYQNTSPITYSGTADVRSTTPSSGYTDASGNRNVFITNSIGTQLTISGINTSNYSSIALSLGHYKSTTASNNELVVEISIDGSSFTALTYTRATGAGTANWILITPTGTIPSTANLRIRFRQTSATPQFRIDDVKLTGTLNTCTAPTTQASNIVYSNIQANSLTASWTNGNGAGRIVKINTTNSFTNPSTGDNPTANTVYSGTGEQVVFNGTGNTVNISGLSPSTNYFVSVYEFCSPDKVYNVNTATNNPLNQTTAAPAGCSAPSTQASNIVYTNTTASAFTASWTNGNGAGRIVKINTSNSFTNPVNGDNPTANPVYSSGEQVIYNGTNNTVDVSGLTENTAYFVRIYEYCSPDFAYNTAAAGNNPNSISTLCTTPSSVSSVSATTASTQVNLAWTNGSCFDEIMVVARQGSAVSFTPSGNGSAYIANSVFASGTDVGSNQYVVYKSNGTTINVTGLSNGQLYHFAIYTRKGNNWSAQANVSATPSIVISGFPIAAANTLYTITFDATLTGVNNGAFVGGLQATPTSGQLDSDAWRINGFDDDNTTAFGETHTTGDFAQGNSNGGETTGGLYAFTIAGSKSLGVQPSDNDFTPGDITLKVQNTGSSAITSLDLAYLLFCRNDAGRSSSFNFSYSIDDASYTTLPLFNYTSPTTSTGASVLKNQRAIQITGLNIASGNFIYLKWSSDDISGGGSRDEFALDNISLIANNLDQTITELTGAYESIVVGPNTSITGNVTVSGSFNLLSGAALNIPSNLSLNVSGLLTNDGTITVQNNASLIQGMSSSLAGSGTYSVLRNKPSGQANDFYNYWTSPVTNGNTSMMPGIFSSYLFTKGGFQTSQYYIHTGALPVGEGLAAKGVSMANFTGTVNNGSLNTSVVRVSDTASYNLVGNPYPSALNAASFVTTNASALRFQTIYLWSQVNPSNYSPTQDFIAINAAGSSNHSVSQTLASTDIASCQSFFVTVNANTSLSFENNMRNGNNSAFKSGEEEPTFPRFWLTLNNNKLGEKSLLIAFPDDAKLKQDAKYDAQSMPSDYSFNSIKNKEAYSIQGYPGVVGGRIIPLEINTPELANYFIALPREENMPSGYDIFLIDKALNNKHNLRQGAYYFLNEEKGINNKRFELGILRANPTGIETQTTQVNTIKLNNGIVSIETLNQEKVASIKVYNLAGQLLASCNDCNQLELGQNASQMLIIQAQIGTQIINHKLFTSK